MINKNILIGIDPDTEKSGVAIKYDGLQLYNMTFFQLYDFLFNFKMENVKVYIECGFLNGGNRHKVLGGSLALNSKIGERIGANHEIAKKICEMCEYLKIEFIQVRPTKTKSNSDYFKKITGYNKRTNQEQRDACLLIWGL
jgi:hypothetical protein